MLKFVRVKVNDSIEWSFGSDKVGGREFSAIIRTNNAIIFSALNESDWATIMLSDCVVLGDDQENNTRTVQDRVDTTASVTAYTALIQLIGSVPKSINIEF
jgi:hypothetical protein